MRLPSAEWGGRRIEPTLYIEPTTWAGSRESWITLYRGAAGAFAVQILGACLALVAHAAIARLSGREQYGIYSFALNVLGVLSVLTLLGQSGSATRFVPTYVQQGRWGELRALRHGATFLVFGASAVVSVIGGLVVHLLRVRLGHDLELTMLGAFALLPVLTQLQLSGALHRGLKRPVSSVAFNNLLRPALLLCLVFGYSLLLHQRLTAPVAMIASFLGSVVTLLCSEWLFSHASPTQAKGAEPRYEMRDWLALGRQLLLLSVVGVVLNRIDVLILGGVVGPAMVGPYYAAVQLAAVAAYGLNAVNAILAPMIAECHSSRDYLGLAVLVQRAAWLTFTVTLLISLGAALLGKWALGLFGSGFTIAYVPLLVMLVGQCTNAILGPVGYLMTMTRFERQAPRIFGGGALVNVLLSVVLVPKFGMLGAAVAATTSTIAWNVVALWYVRTRLGINPTIVSFGGP